NAENPFTAIQADAILELQLHRLTKLSIDEISKELASTRDNIAEYESILGSEKKLRGVIIKELEEIKKQYGDERRTKIEDEAAGKGKHVGNLVGLQPGETVRTMLAVRNLEQEQKYILFTTRNGLVKKTELKDFSHVRANGIYAISIEQGDELVAATVTDGQQIIFLATHEGQAIRFDEEGVRPMGRQAYGVWGIRMEKGDYVVGMATTPKDIKKAEAEAAKAAAEAGVPEATATDETL